MELAPIILGADLNQKDNSGKSILMFVASRDFIYTKYLVKYGANIQTKNNNGKTVFDYTYSHHVKNYLKSKL